MLGFVFFFFCFFFFLWLHLLEIVNATKKYCDIIASEFDFQLRNYFHFRTTYPWEKYELPYFPSEVLNITTAADLQD